MDEATKIEFARLKQQLEAAEKEKEEEKQKREAAEKDLDFSLDVSRGTHMKLFEAFLPANSSKSQVDPNIEASVESAAKEIESLTTNTLSVESKSDHYTKTMKDHWTDYSLDEMLKFALKADKELDILHFWRALTVLFAKSMPESLNVCGWSEAGALTNMKEKFNKASAAVKESANTKTDSDYNPPSTTKSPSVWTNEIGHKMEAAMFRVKTSTNDIGVVSNTDGLVTVPKIDLNTYQCALMFFEGKGSMNKEIIRDLIFDCGCAIWSRYQYLKAKSIPTGSLSSPTTTNNNNNINNNNNASTTTTTTTTSTTKTSTTSTTTTSTSTTKTSTTSTTTSTSTSNEEQPKKKQKLEETVSEEIYNEVLENTKKVFMAVDAKKKVVVVGTIEFIGQKVARRTAPTMEFKFTSMKKWKWNDGNLDFEHFKPIRDAILNLMITTLKAAAEPLSLELPHPPDVNKVVKIVGNESIQIDDRWSFPMYMDERLRISQISQNLVLKQIAFTCPDPIDAQRLLELEASILRQISEQQKAESCVFIPKFVFFGKDQNNRLCLLSEGFGHNSLWTAKLCDSQIDHVINSIKSALEAIHKIGYVYCDLNPGNVVINNTTQQTFLIDFESCIPIGSSYEDVRLNQLTCSPHCFPRETKSKPEHDFEALKLLEYWLKHDRSLPYQDALRFPFPWIISEQKMVLLHELEEKLLSS